MKRFDQRNGFSLVEILVVMAVFAVLAVVSTQSLVLTLKGSKKSESIVHVRENLSYAVSVMERNLYNAEDIVVANCTAHSIEYEDEFGTSPDPTFNCVDIDGGGGNVGYIASGSGRLTSSEIDVTACSFSCAVGIPDKVPPSVVLSFTAEDVNSSGIEGAQVSISTKILLRSY